MTNHLSFRLGYGRKLPRYINLQINDPDSGQCIFQQTSSLQL